MIFISTMKALEGMNLIEYNNGRGSFLFNLVFTVNVIGTLALILAAPIYIMLSQCSRLLIFSRFQLDNFHKSYPFKLIWYVRMFPYMCRIFKQQRLNFGQIMRPSVYRTYKAKFYILNDVCSTVSGNQTDKINFIKNFQDLFVYETIY